MRRLRPFSIVVGILVDTVSSVALAIVYSLFVFGRQLDPGEPPTNDSAGLWNVAVTEILGLLPMSAMELPWAWRPYWCGCWSNPSRPAPNCRRGIERSRLSRWFQQVPLAATLPRGELRGRSNRRVAHAKTN